MKYSFRNLFLLIVILSVVLVGLTGCDDKNNNAVIEEEDFTAGGKNIDDEKDFTWLVSPSKDYDDVIDIRSIPDVSVVKINDKYQLVSSDGKQFTTMTFSYYGEGVNDITVWDENAVAYTITADGTVTEIGTLGTELFDSNVYYNTQRNELFTQDYYYTVEKQPNTTSVTQYRDYHGTLLAPYIEVTPKSFDDTQYQEFADFDESCYGKYGYYNYQTLELVENMKYDFALPFFDGMAAVKKDGKAGYIDLDGNPIFDFEFEEARNFENGKAWVKSNGKWGVIVIKKQEDEVVSSNWEELYKDYITNSNLPDNLSASTANTNMESYIYFFDCNFDGVPELFYYDGNTPSTTGTRTEYVYTIENGIVKKAAEVTAGNATMLIVKDAENNGYVMCNEYAETHDFYDAKLTVIENGQDKFSGAESVVCDTTALQVEYASTFAIEKKIESINTAIQLYKPYIEFLK